MNGISFLPQQRPVAFGTAGSKAAGQIQLKIHRHLEQSGFDLSKVRVFSTGNSVNVEPDPAWVSPERVANAVRQGLGDTFRELSVQDPALEALFTNDVVKVLVFKQNGNVFPL
jgi:hypothetical protein